MNLESPILGQTDPSFLKCTEQFTMADVQISAHPADIHSMQEAPMELYQPDIAIDTGAEVEVSTGARRGRGRPKKGFLKKEIPKPAEGTTKPKRAYKKRAPKVVTETDVVPKAKRKYTPRRPKNAGVEPADKKEVKEPKEKKGKDKRKEGGRRKKEPVEKKPRERKPREKKPPREKKQKKKDIQIALPVNLIPIVHHSESSNDSVVFCSELTPSSVLPPAPPGPLSPPGAAGGAGGRGGGAPGSRSHGRLSPASSSSGGKRSQVISRLEDSSSSGGSGSGSSSSDDEDGSSSSDDSSQSDKERQRYTPSPPPPPVIRSNGISNHLSMSDGWSDRSSASEGEREGQGRGDRGDDAARLDSPPRSPSSASSECPDKPFQCHTCKKWFSTTVTLRIHKRSHVAKPSGGSGSGGGRASRRYECDCCEATFTRRERLEQHRSERHRGTLTERCEVCGRGFEDEEQQKRHFATHTPDERAGRCTECGEIYSSWEQLRRHRAAHAPPAPHACPLCRKAFTYSHSLSRHLSNHSKAVYKCVVCKTSFNDANSLASHLNSHLDRYRQLKTS